MIEPQIPLNENFRLKVLNDYSILDTLPEKEYDDITELASQICGTPIATISLIDETRQWFKSTVGLDADHTSRQHAFCAHAIIEPDKIFTVHDSTKDERFHDNPLVTGEPKVIFYTGVPLVSSEGAALGTLCVIDNKPNELNEFQLKALKSLSNQVITLFDLRKSKIQLEQKSKDLEIRNVELKKFAHIAAHDLKSPLSNMSTLTHIILEDYSEKLDEIGKNYLKLLNQSSEVLWNLVDGILQHSQAEEIYNNGKEFVNFGELLSDIIDLLDSKKEYYFNKNFQNKEIYINKIGIQQILINLLANGIKYNDKEKIEINIDFFETDLYYNFSITDNGPGIDDKNQQKIFDIFEVLAYKDRFGKKGNGIGLSTVKKLVSGFGGEINVNSRLNESTTFSFSISKFDTVQD